jgi:hypothetical protein
MPTSTQAGDYSSTIHYLNAVAVAGTDDADAVMRKMREMPVNDFFAQNGHIREDGLMIHPLSCASEVAGAVEGGGARPHCPAQIDFTSPPSMRSVEPVIQRAPGDTRKAISSATSSGSP